jgi:hypothetical protein
LKEEMANDHSESMRWVLFWVFVTLFVVIVVATLLTVFFHFGSPSESERKALFTAFIVEIAAAVFALFYSLFGLRKSGKQSRVRLGLGVGDTRKLVGKTAVLSFSDGTGEKLGGDMQRQISDDNGPLVLLEPPQDAHDVLVTVKLGGENYEGSFVIGTHLVDLTKSEA